MRKDYLIIIVFISIFSIIAQAVTPLWICNDGDRRCSGNVIEVCINNGWRFYKQCDYKCYAPIDRDPYCVILEEEKQQEFYNSLTSWGGFIILILIFIIIFYFTYKKHKKLKEKYKIKRK